jgi:hypothetical protein
VPTLANVLSFQCALGWQNKPGGTTDPEEVWWWVAFSLLDWPSGGVQDGSLLSPPLSLHSMLFPESCSLELPPSLSYLWQGA